MLKQFPDSLSFWFISHLQLYSLCQTEPQDSLHVTRMWQHERCIFQYTVYYTCKCTHYSNRTMLTRLRIPICVWWETFWALSRWARPLETTWKGTAVAAATVACRGAVLSQGPGGWLMPKETRHPHWQRRPYGNANMHYANPCVQGWPKCMTNST